MTNELKSCPWCGNEMHIGSEEPFFQPDRFMFYIYHSHPYPDQCVFGKHGNLSTDFFDTKQEAIAAWNREDE